jgi:hypothetical protein
MRAAERDYLVMCDLDIGCATRKLLLFDLFSIPFDELKSVMIALFNN